MSHAALALVILHELIVLAAIVHVLLADKQPAKTMAWALVLFFVPIGGLALYVFFGIDTRKERLISQRSMTQLTKRSMLEFAEQHNLSVADSYKPLVELFVNQNVALPFKDNAVEIITSGSDFFLRLLRDIGSAKSHIHIDIYIFCDDPLGRLIADALIDKAREGVEVRVVYDDVGCFSTARRFFERLREEGIEVCPFLPVRFPSFTSKVNYRDHRKIFVIDGRVGYIGGMNIALRYVSGRRGQQWRDTMVRLTGGGVYGLQRAFLVDWYFTDRTLLSNRKYYPPLPPDATNNCIAQTVTSSPVAPFPDIMQGFVRLILAARSYIYIQTPYFLPTEPVMFALKTAALGGVDIRLMVPRKGDSRFVDAAGRSFLREAMAAGVKVYMYAGGFLHSKTLVCDDGISTCGSTNIDFRSFEEAFEANIFFYDTPTAIRFKQMFLEDQKHSIPFAAAPEASPQPLPARLWESAARLLSPVM